MIGTGQIERSRISREPRKLPYISTVSFDKTSYKYRDTSDFKIHLHNPTKNYYIHPRLEIKVVNRNHAEIYNEILPMHRVPALKPATEEEHGTETVSSHLLIDKEYGKGRSLVRFTLFEEVNNEKVLYDQKVYGLWVMEEPPELTRRGSTGGTENHHGKAGSLRRLEPIHVPDSEDDELPHADLSIGEIWFNTEGKRIRHTWKTNTRAANSVLFELIAEYFVDIKGDLLIEQMQSRNVTDVKGLFKQLENARKKFLQICESDETNPR